MNCIGNDVDLGGYVGVLVYIGKVVVGERECTRQRIKSGAAPTQDFDRVGDLLLFQSLPVPTSCTSSPIKHFALLILPFAFSIDHVQSPLIPGATHTTPTIKKCYLPGLRA